MGVGDEGDDTVGRIEDVTGNRRRQERIAVLDRVLRDDIRNEADSIVGYLRAVVVQSDTDDRWWRMRRREDSRVSPAAGA